MNSKIIIFLSLYNSVMGQYYNLWGSNNQNSCQNCNSRLNTLDSKVANIQNSITALNTKVTSIQSILLIKAEVLKNLDSKFQDLQTTYDKEISDLEIKLNDNVVNSDHIFKAFQNEVDEKISNLTENLTSTSDAIDLKFEDFNQTSNELLEETIKNLKKYVNQKIGKVELKFGDSINEMRDKFNHYKKETNNSIDQIKSKIILNNKIDSKILEDHTKNFLQKSDFEISIEKLKIESFETIQDLNDSLLETFEQLFYEKLENLTDFTGNHKLELLQTQSYHEASSKPHETNSITVSMMGVMIGVLIVIQVLTIMYMLKMKTNVIERKPNEEVVLYVNGKE